MDKKRLEFDDGKSRKFWEISVEGNAHTITFGRIGSAGQIKKKEFASPQAAQADAAKLVAQKLKKGYSEASEAEEESPAAPGPVGAKKVSLKDILAMKEAAAKKAGKKVAAKKTVAKKAVAAKSAGSASSLASLETAPDQRSALFEYLKPLLTQSPECEKLLERLLEGFQELSLSGDGGFEFSFSDTREDEEYTVTFLEPFTGTPDESVPSSMIDFCRVHNGVEWTGYLDSGFNGLTDNGEVASGGWECEALEEAEKSNADFLKKLKDAGLEVDDVPGPFDYGQNWLILHPGEKNKIGESRLYFVSHGDCKAVPVKAAENLRWGPIVLRVMVQNMLGRSGFTEVYD